MSKVLYAIIISILTLSTSVAKKYDLQIDTERKKSIDKYHEIRANVIIPDTPLHQKLYEMIYNGCKNMEYFIFGAAIKDGFSFRSVFNGCFDDFINQENKKITNIRYATYPSFKPLHYGFNRERKFHPLLCVNENLLDLCHDSRVEFKPIVTSDSTEVDIQLQSFEKLSDDFECFYGDARKFGFDDNDLSFAPGRKLHTYGYAI